ncbi:hypothetical protein IJ00_12650 [Calothrix sp. 336/3]|nr:hypothetical protein IJ00_12650 [Calothrix sp. 336/3]
MVTDKNNAVNLQKLRQITSQLFRYQLPLILFNCCLTLPTIAAEPEAVLSIVQSSENANQWSGIINRLQGAKVKYCVIPLDEVKNMADWGDRPVLFLPNIENLSPTQAIALEEWMSKGGRLIASGPVGSVSAPGVRQLLRSLLGGYWGFSLDKTQTLQPPKDKTPRWANKTELFGKVQGGVVINDSSSAQTVAVWNNQNNQVGVLATPRSTFFGWRWGVDTASSPALDTAWLETALKRHVEKDSINISKIAEANSKCSTTVTAKKTTPGVPRSARDTRKNPPLSSPTSPPFGIAGITTTTTATTAKTPRSDEAIDQLEQSVKLDVLPNSQAPISYSEAIALQSELTNLIGRVESAHLAAAANNNKPLYAQPRQAQFASVKSGAPIGTEQILNSAREVAKNLPLWVQQRQYAQARQQWLAAKSALWQQFPLESPIAQPEIRAMWLDRGTIVKARNEAGLAKIFDRLAQAGINTVFFETLNASYTIYPSQVAPEQNPLIRNWDPLASAVKLAHARGMELHAWVWVFAAGNNRHNEILNIDKDYPGPVLARNPDWAGFDNRGQRIPIGQGKPFFDPANPQVRQYLINLYTEIVTRYNVDGLQLDYIRYPFQDARANRTYGYGKAAREQFQQQHGVDPMTLKPSQIDLWEKWTDFRTQQVNSFVAQVSQDLKRKRPNLMLSVAVFPLQERERIHKIQQNWEVWARRGDIDFIVPMTYAQDTVRFERLAQPWIASSRLGATLLVPGIRLLALPTIGAFDQIQLVRDLPTSGYALFAAENLGKDLYTVFSNTQGNPSSRKIKEPIPHRQPFQTAAIRYSALQQEWKLLLQNESQKLPETSLTELNSQAEKLQTALNRLAEAPNVTKFVTAKASLSRFQSQFRVLMRPQMTTNSYQVRVWENRLIAIEKLLRFGERVLLSPK